MNQLWTEDNDRQLYLMVRRGQCMSNICADLGKSYIAVKRRIKKLKIHARMDPERKPVWSHAWGKGLHFEDDPRACRREPLFTMPRASQGMPAVSSMADCEAA